MGKPSIKDDVIIGKIVTRLTAIAAGDDYYTTFANKVFDNKATPWEASELPGINVRDISEEMLQEQPYGSDDYHDVNMYVELDIVATGSSVANIRKMRGDVFKSIGTDLTWDSEAFHTYYLSAERDRVDQLGTKVADVTIRIGIQFRKNAWSS